MKIGMIGAGAGGMAMAFDLSQLDHDVFLFELPGYEALLENLEKNGRVIRVDGMKEGEARVQPSMDWEKLSHCRVIFVVTVAQAHPLVAARLVPFLNPGQTVVYLPGNLGSLYLREALAKQGRIPQEVQMIETNTLPYGVRVDPIDRTRIHIPILTPSLLIGGDDEADQEASDLLKYLCPDSYFSTLLGVFLSNPNPLFHPLPCLLSASAIEERGVAFDLYRDGMMPSTILCMQKLDRERQSLLEQLNRVEWVRGLEWAKYYGLVSVDGKFRRMHFLECGKAASLGGPAHLAHRYLTEDTQTGLVCWERLGMALGVSVPIISSTITLISSLLGMELRREGAERSELMVVHLLNR